MSLSTYSKFFYGHTVTRENQYIDILEGVDPVTVIIPVGSYSFTKFLEVVSQAFNNYGADNYSVTASRVTGIVTIVSDGTFDILGATGANVSRSALPLLGFPQTDQTGLTTVSGTSRSGYEYKPQFILQDHVPTDKLVKALSATVSKSASGNKVSVQSFGEERFLKCNIKFITNIPQPGNSKIRTNVLAVNEVLDFLNYITTKAPVEYMANENDTQTYEIVILESTVAQSDGTGFELREYYDKNLPGYFETGLLTFKAIEE